VKIMDCSNNNLNKKQQRTKKPEHWWRAVIIVLCLVVCSIQHHASAKAVPLGVQSVDPYADNGKIHLLTVSYKSAEEVPVVEYQFVEETSHKRSAPVRIDKDRPRVAYANRGNDIHIVAKGAHIYALWTTSGEGPMGSGPLVAAASEDNGTTWKPALPPSDDHTTSGHRFTDLIADEQGRFHAIWLDNRTGTQALYYSRSLDYGKSWSPNILIDAKTCECCWNRIALEKPNRLYVL
jgi:hypothetical protein